MGVQQPEAGLGSSGTPQQSFPLLCHFIMMVLKGCTEPSGKITD